MRVSRDQVSANRRTILEAAGRLFRARGFADVTVAEIMQAAGLTHGGFYGYFPSKDALIACALAEADGPPLPGDGLAGYAARYLSRRHRDDPAGGCATAALAGEAARLGGAARARMTEVLRRQNDRLAAAAPGATPAARRQAATGSWAAMVGALILARLCDDAALSDEVLDATLAWLRAQDAR